MPFLVVWLLLVGVWVADALPQLLQLLGFELELVAELLVVVEYGEGLRED